MPRRTRASDPNARTKPAPAPVVIVKATQEALDLALEIAGGERRRLVVEPSGSVLVVNRPR